MKTSSENAVFYAIGGALSMAAAMGIGRFVFTPILPDMMQATGMNAADAGFVASANYIGYLAGAIFGGYGWSVGRERIAMLTGLGMSAALCLAMALSGHVVLFSVIRFLAGFTSAVTMILSTTIVLSHLLQARHARLGALHFGGVGAGIALSAIMIGLLHFFDFGWRTDWIFSAILSVALLAAVAWFVREGPMIEGAADGASRREPALRRSFAFEAVSLSYGIFGFGYVITATFLIAIVRDGNAPFSMEITVWVLTGVAAALSIWLWSPITSRIGLFNAVALTCVIEAAGVAASVLLPVGIGPLVGGLLLGGTFMAITAFAIQAGRFLAPQAPRRALARMTVYFSIGQIAGPLVAGYMARQSGSFTAPSLVAALALVVSAVLAYAAGRSVQNRQHA